MPKYMWTFALILLNGLFTAGVSKADLPKRVNFGWAATNIDGSITIGNPEVEAVGAFRKILFSCEENSSTRCIADSSSLAGVCKDFGYEYEADMGAEGEVSREYRGLAIIEADGNARDEVQEFRTHNELIKSVTCMPKAAE